MVAHNVYKKRPREGEGIDLEKAGWSRAAVVRRLESLWRTHDEGFIIEWDSVHSQQIRLSFLRLNLFLINRKSPVVPQEVLRKHRSQYSDDERQALM